MTLVLSANLEERLGAEASRRGVTIEECAGMLLGEALARHDGSAAAGRSGSLAATQEERKRAFHDLIEGFRDIDAPPIPVEALRRENLYDDRGR